jgi:hypothetical protein
MPPHWLAVKAVVQQLAEEAWELVTLALALVTAPNPATRADAAMATPAYLRRAVFFCIPLGSSFSSLTNVPFTARPAPVPVP